MEEIMKALEIATTDKYKFKGIYATEQINGNKIENFIKANYDTYCYKTYTWELILTLNTGS